MANHTVFACGAQICPYEPTVRTCCSDDHIAICGWPSRGGMITLDDAQAVDFDFVGMNPVDPRMERDDNQESEDAFCQRLLLLGAKWWDSEARYMVVHEIENRPPGRRPRRLEHGPYLEPTMRE